MAASSKKIALMCSLWVIQASVPVLNANIFYMYFECFKINLGSCENILKGISGKWIPCGYQKDNMGVFV